MACVTLVGCKKEMDARRQHWLDSAGACPAPATCSAKMTAAAREISICAPALDKQALGAGDVVVVRELVGAHDTVGRIKQRRSAGFDVEFPDGATLERSSDVVIARVCR